MTKVTPHCGAEVSGVNLSEPLDEVTVKALELALAEH
ncbi:MAG: TauD/TfdA family dioxygenase, partial [Planctomycetaceae bacterium]|nr:TauD/TfdA family dioxygenase [Planctomycetaceae bacterium]